MLVGYCPSQGPFASEINRRLDDTIALRMPSHESLDAPCPAESLGCLPWSYRRQHHVDDQIMRLSSKEWSSNWLMKVMNLGIQNVPNDHHGPWDYECLWSPWSVSALIVSHFGTPIFTIKTRNRGIKGMFSFSTEDWMQNLPSVLKYSALSSNFLVASCMKRNKKIRNVISHR